MCRDLSVSAHSGHLMDYFKRFNFLFAAPVFDADDLEGVRFNQIIEEIQRSGFEVVRARKLEDAEMAVQTDAAIGCMVVDWGKKGLEGKTSALINLMRRRGLDFPIILLIRRKRFEDLPVEVLDFGDLLTHEGPALQAQKEAAQIFGAEKTYFVLNGTSTSNKVALSALVTDGDLVLFDRNNHKAAHHGALMISGGT